jgi:putative CocE/NonD family hydrolase
MSSEGSLRRAVPYLPCLALSLTLSLALAVAPLPAPTARAQAQEDRDARAERIRRSYSKFEYRIPMRDGVRLFTSVYIPDDRSKTYPILMRRTPYGVGPYGASRYMDDLGPNPILAEKGYIFVYQDVREKYMSEGKFLNMTPHLETKRGPQDVDESTDTYDTIEWLLAHLPNHNGRVGMWGISYPGFYTAAGMIDSHPALKAASPQAPIADWFWDDFHHHGAFFLPHAFNFIASFGKERPEPTTERPQRFEHGTPDGYQFFLDMGPLSNANEKYLKGEIEFWNQLVEHPNYDEFWQKRNLLPHLKNISTAVMTVGGWFDAEDLYGALKIYRTVERNNPGIFNMLVMGPWVHGGWSRTDGEKLSHVHFGFKTSEWYQKHIETPFFEHFLRGEDLGDEDDAGLPEAFVFETGANRWRTFDHWPPASVEERALYLGDGGTLGWQPPPGTAEGPGEGSGVEPEAEAFDEYVSDPDKPVPYTEVIDIGMSREYMVSDQRFAGRRPDVLVFETDVLNRDLTLAGPIQAELWVSTSGTASDWVVKLIDVLPPDFEEEERPRIPWWDRDRTAVPEKKMGNYWMMVRSEVFRGRFRDSYEHPEPFEPNRPTRVSFELQDVLHTFQRGHRVMVQIQSTWFPLVDRNPQTWVPNIFKAKEEDFRKATQRVYHSPQHPTRLVVGVLPAEDEEE